MKVTSHNIRSGNITLAANVYGKAGKPTLLLAHGYPDDSSVWHQLVPLLAKDFRVITYDVRGCGRSQAPKRRKHYGMRYLMADQFNVIRALSPDQPVHLVAHDWGSIQSWEAVTEPGAERYLASFTSLSGPCLDHVGKGLIRSFGEKPLASLNQLVHSWYIGFFHLPLLAPSLWKLGLATAWPQLIAMSEGVELDPAAAQRKNGVNGINLYRANMLKHLTQPRERYAQVPVQAIIADDDNYVTPTLLEELPHWVEQLEQHHLATGHWGLLHEAPEETARLIRNYVQRQEAGHKQAATLSSEA